MGRRLELHHSTLQCCLQICNDCFSITGPSNATVQYFNAAPGASSSYQLMLTWSPDYLGPITVGVDT